MRLIIKMVLALSFVLSLSGTLFAKGLDAKIDRYFANCAEQSSTQDISQCLGRQYAEADAELNMVWKQVLAMISGSTHIPVNDRRSWKHNITEGQRFWVKFKEAECKGSVPYKYWQGTMASVESLSCLLRLTVVRTFELGNYLGY